MGPAFVAHHYELRDMRPRLRHRKVDLGEEAWLDVSARAAERARVSDLMAALARAIESRDESSFDQLRHGSPT